MDFSEDKRTGNGKVRHIPIEKIESSKKERIVPIKKLDQEARFKLHTNPAERTITAGAPISPATVSSRRPYGISLAEQHSRNRARVDGLWLACFPAPIISVLYSSKGSTSIYQSTIRLLNSFKLIYF